MDRFERIAAIEGDAADLGRQRLDLEPVDGGDEMPVVQQMVRQSEAGRAEADNEHLAAGRRLRRGRRRLSGFQRVSSE